jgi:hypothetical protein
MQVASLNRYSQMSFIHLGVKPFTKSDMARLDAFRAFGIE